MGGYGSGRPRLRAHLGQVPSLNVARVAGMAEGQSAHIWGSGLQLMRLDCTPHGFDLVNLAESATHARWIRVHRSPCHFGGSRLYFRCDQCFRLARILYFYRGGIVCRRCTHLRYRSQSQSYEARLIHTIRRLQKRLAPKFDPNDLETDWIPGRPSGMRRRMYWRLRARLDRAIQAYDAQYEQRIVQALVTLGMRCRWGFKSA